MRAMKDSGVEWLGAIPQDWGISKFRFVFRESKEVNGATPVGEMLSVSGPRGVVPKVYAEESLKRDANQLENYRVVRRGQLAVNTMWLNHGGLGISELEGHVSPAYRTYWINHKVLQQYAHHLLRSQSYISGYTSYLTGVRPNSLQMSRDNLMNFPVLIPPLEEQKAIVEYLEAELPQIDLLISKKEQLIEKLLERRQALITQAVTKGLDPNVPMKDTGVEWIGAMPRDFELDKASRFFKARKGSSAALLSVEYCAAHPGQYPVYSGQTENGGVMAEIDTFEFEFHEKPVLFTTTVGSSKVMSVDLLSGRFSLSQNCMILVPTSEDKLLTKYAFWMLQALFLEKKKELSAHMQLSFRMTDFYGYRLIVPPTETQREVASYLETETKKIEQITSAAISAITLLKERRQALVTQVVTGKLDVRGFASGNS